MKKFFLFLLLNFILSSGGSKNFEFVEKDTKIDVLLGKKLITSYLHSPDLLKPCLYPVYSTSGEQITRQYPFKEVEGESKDHPHHTGVYFTYASQGEVSGNSFWNIHDIPPQIRHIKTVKLQGGATGILSVQLHWIDKNNHVLLIENREMYFSNSGNDISIDFDIKLEAKNSPVIFKDTKEGMFAIRVADWLSEENGSGEYMNSKGTISEKNIWGKRAEWVRLQAEKNNKTFGVAIFHHPSSVNYPTYWHARGYGCFAANPIGQLPFQQYWKEKNPHSRELKIQPGKSELFRFRLLIYEGLKSIEELSDIFTQFSRK